MSKISIIKEFVDFLRHNKKWWLAPIIITLILFGALIIFAQASPAAPFVYTLF